MTSTQSTLFTTQAPDGPERVSPAISNPERKTATLGRQPATDIPGGTRRKNPPDPRPWWLLATPVRPGYWIMRFRLAGRQWGPSTPVCIVWLHTRVEPFAPDNHMERSPFLAAFAAGLPIGIWDVQPSTHTSGRISRIEQRITRQEYDQQMAEILAARREDRYLPAAVPFEPISIKQVEIPFSRKGARA